MNAAVVLVLATAVIGIPAYGSPGQPRARVVSTIKASGNPFYVAFAAGAVWLTTGDGKTDRIDPATNAVTASVDVGREGIAAAANDVWVSYTSPGSDVGSVSRIDSATNAVSVTANVSVGPDGVAIGGGSVWVTNPDDGTVTRIDQATGQVTKTIDLTLRAKPRTPFAGGPHPGGIAYGDGRVWVADDKANTVQAIDPATDRVGPPIKVGRSPYNIEIGHGAVWVTNNSSASVSVINPRTKAVTRTIKVGAGAWDLAFGAQSLWVTNNEDGTVSRVDPKSKRVTQTLEVGNEPNGIAFGGDSIWVANYYDNTVTRIAPAG